LAPNTALLSGGQTSNTTTTTNVPINATTSFNETGAAV